MTTTDPDVLAADAINLALADAIYNHPHGIDDLAKPGDVRFNMVMGKGQSFALGSFAVPPVSNADFDSAWTRILDDCWMVGESVRPRSSDYAALDGDWYPPLGDAVLHPLQATAESKGVVTSSLTPTDCATLDLSAHPAFGENLIVGATIRFAELWAAVPTRPHADFVASCVAFGGRTIEELLPGADPELWQRTPASCDMALSAIEAAFPASPSQLLAGVRDQGQSNYIQARGGTGDKDAFKALTRQDILDTEALAVSKFGQTTRPAWIIFQPGGVAAQDALGLSIGNAVTELAREMDNVFLVGPDGHYPNYLYHPDSNSQRWMGMQASKVMQRVLIGRKGWEPLDACRFERRDARTVWAHHIVPAPPLKWLKVYIGQKPTTLVDRGFAFEDLSGAVPMAATPKILGQTVVEFKFTRDLVGTDDEVLIACGPQSLKGCCNLADSDSTVFPEHYRFLPGMQAAANIVALVDQPYPAANYCVGYRRPLSWSR